MDLSDWMAEDEVLFLMRFSKTRMAKAGYELDRIKAEIKDRTPEQGVFDGQPWVKMAGSLSVLEARRAAGRVTTKREMKFREDESVMEVDLDPDDQLRRVAIAIKEVGGDWRTYHLPLSDAEVKRFAGWAGLSFEGKVEALRALAEEDFERMRKRLSKSVVDDEALGK